MIYSIKQYIIIVIVITVITTTIVIVIPWNWGASFANNPYVQTWDWWIFNLSFKGPPAQSPTPRLVAE